MKTTVLVATDIGVVASEALEPGRSGRVEAVFDRAFYVCLGKEWICVGTSSIGRGPINLLVDGAVSSLGLRRGETCVTVGRRLRVGSIEIDAAGALPWPTASSVRSARPRPRELLASLPADGSDAAMIGLGCFIAPGARPESRTARAAAPAVAHLSDWLIGGSREPAPRRAVARLLGLGPGLTPSGDDFLAGCIAALRMMGIGAAADALWDEVARQAPAATSPLSFAHLSAANRCGLAEPVHNVLKAAIGERREALRAAFASLRSSLHASPFDALAGAALPLRYAPTVIERRGCPAVPAGTDGRRLPCLLQSSLPAALECP